MPLNLLKLPAYKPAGNSGGNPQTNFLRRLKPYPPQPSLLILTGKKFKQTKSVERARSSLLPSDESETKVPKGHLAVYVGPELRRFVIPASYLSLPRFRVLMERAGEEFGFAQEGGLKIPCEEKSFEEILRALEKESRKKSRT